MIVDIPRRLALVLAMQITVCVYLVLGVGSLIKIRVANPHLEEFYNPVSPLSFWVKSWGWTLMAIPILWYSWHVRYWFKTGCDFSLLWKVVLSGVAIIGFLLFFAFVASVGVFMPHIVHIR